MFLEETVERDQRPRLELVRSEPSVVHSDLNERLRWYFALEFARDCDVCYLVELFKP